MAFLSEGFCRLGAHRAKPAPVVALSRMDLGSAEIMASGATGPAGEEIILSEALAEGREHAAQCEPAFPTKPVPLYPKHLGPSVPSA